MVITQPNFFDILGERQIVQPVKRRMEKADRRAAVEARKKEEKDEAKQMAYYRVWKREMRAEMIAQHGVKLEALMKMLKNMTMESSGDLVDYIEHADWLIKADPHSRVTILGYIDYAIIRLRIRHGLAPFDDALPGEEDLTVFQIIRKILTGV